MRPERIDASSAAEWGEVIPLIDDPAPSSYQFDAFKARLREALERRQFDPARDFLIMAPPITHCAFVLGLLTARFRRVRVLILHPSQGHYRWYWHDHEGFR